MLDLISNEIFNEPFSILQTRTAFIILFRHQTELFIRTDFQNRNFLFNPIGLLFETDIREQQINCFDISGRPAFFQTDGDFPFDIFAAAFFLVSRYEEYLSFQPDKYGRFPHQASLAFKENFLEIP